MVELGSEPMLLWFTKPKSFQDTSLTHMKRLVLPSREHSSQLRKQKSDRRMDLSKVSCSLEVELGPEFLASGT